MFAAQAGAFSGKGLFLSSLIHTFYTFPLSRTVLARLQAVGWIQRNTKTLLTVRSSEVMLTSSPLEHCRATLCAVTSTRKSRCKACWGCDLCGRTLSDGLTGDPLFWNTAVACLEQLGHQTTTKDSLAWLETTFYGKTQQKCPGTDIHRLWSYKGNFLILLEPRICQEDCLSLSMWHFVTCYTTEICSGSPLLLQLFVWGRLHTYV